MVGAPEVVELPVLVVVGSTRCAVVEVACALLDGGDTEDVGLGLATEVEVMPGELDPLHPAIRPAITATAGPTVRRRQVPMP